MTEHLTAADVLARQKDWLENFRQRPERRIALAKLAIKMGDMNALDALAELALRALKAEPEERR